MISNYPKIQFFLTFLVCILFLASCNQSKEEASKPDRPLDPKVEKLKLQPGFTGDHLYSPSEHEQGSWVSMTFDNKGRLITADQYGSLYRLEIPAIGDSSEVKVEKLLVGEIDSTKVSDTTKTTIGMGYAQGVLYAFNSLYVMVNHESNDDFEKSTGLYRLQDLNGDDQFEKITLIKTLTGQEGEHGPHSIVMAPDKKSLFVIAGNHTDVPKMDDYRLPSNWKDDNLFPQIKDPRGHANERQAPGGWIAHIDSLGQHWELISAGFRNPFDLAFNEAGDMFTYDSDMEWDLGMPWYRPTRICHVTSGSEFGWRTGNGKWSPVYPDNLPPLLNIGQGSPTNVISLKDAKFPQQYQNTLLAFDWSFGIMYAIHLQPKGASYAAEKEEFISGMPLPLTDGVIGPDGALYFMTGGRRLDSDVYRVYFDSDDEENFKTVATKADPEAAKARETRLKLEEFHGDPNSEAVDYAWPFLKSQDRFIQYAARIAVEHQPVKTWESKALNEKDPIILTQGMVALARQGTPAVRDKMLQALMEIKYDELSPLQQVDLVRAFELTMARMGMPSGSMKTQVVDYLSPQYPAQTDILNQSLSKVLSYLNAPQVIDRTLTLLETKVDENSSTMLGNATDANDLILRNPQYGMDIAQTLKNLPPAQHTYYATVLSNVRSGWTPELRERYFSWFYQAFDFQGGRSYIGFLDKARQNALAIVPKSEFDYYNKISGDSLLTNNGNDLADVPSPKGPRKNYEEKDIEMLLDSMLIARDFENGKNMYAATRCSSCHVMGGDGGNVGPNLTQLGTRFSPKDIMESIIEPSKVISDQYMSTALILENGQSIVGRIINETDDHYTISQNPFAPDVTRDIPKSQVKDKKASSVSVMPPGLANSLGPNEFRDLVAYLISGGNKNHQIYTGDGKEAENVSE